MEDSASPGSRDSGRRSTKGDRRARGGGEAARVRSGKGEGAKNYGGGGSRGGSRGGLGGNESHGGREGHESRAFRNSREGRNTSWHRMFGPGGITADFSPAQMQDFLQNSLKIIETGSAQE